MFNFRIITTADGNQIIDRNLKTLYESLTPIQMVEYEEVDSQLAFMDRIKKKKRINQINQKENILQKIKRRFI